MKRQPTEWETTVANDATNKGLISKTYKQVLLPNKNNDKTPYESGQKT